ncbi:MAG: hypothetical protein U0228_05715 [Myxococcaceae bacterium]
MTPLRIGYAPYSQALTQPGDRRRFVHWARARGVQYELASPEREYDVVVISNAADLTRWARMPRGKLVFDFIDSYLAVPKTDWRGALRGTAKFLSRQHAHLEPSYWKTLEAVCRRADAVICSTEEQRADISAFCANVHRILDVHTAATAVIKSDYRAAEPFKFVWEGLPYTLPLLFGLAPVLARLPRRWELHVVTNPSAPRFLGRFGRRDTVAELRAVFPSAVFHEWRDETFASTVTACDAALIPLDLEDPFTRGKPENKLLLFWRVGMPVVTSASPAYARAMEATGVPLTCRSPSDWAGALERVMGDEALRREAGTRGRQFAESEHSEAKILARWDAVFASLGLNFQQVEGH